jgi:hypothetical protein
VAKPKAREAFARAMKRINGGRDPMAVVMAGLERAKASRKWQEGFIPNPATWLNQDRWDDEPDETARAPPVTAGMMAAASDELAFRMATGQVHGRSNQDRDSQRDQSVVVALPAPAARHG